MRPAILHFLILGSLLLTFQSGDCLAEDSNGNVSDAQLAAAIATLKTNQIYSTVTRDRFGATNLAQYEQRLQLYKDQTSAIDTLGKAKILGTAPILIPYLDFASLSLLPALNLEVPWKSTDAMLQLWPALAALVEIPGSGQVLADYTLNTNNPSKSRIAALSALKYIDNQRFNSIYDVIAAEFSKSDSATKYIQSIKNSRFIYMGTRFLDDLSDGAQDSNSVVSDDAVAAAIKTLKTTEVIDDPKNRFGISRSFKGSNFWEVFDAQTNAIAVLAKAKRSGTASLLIPYLDYPSTNYMSLRAYHHTIDNEVTNDTLSIWPALHALTEIPGSSQALSQYIINTNNPADFRLTAFWALRYVDRNQLKPIGDKLTAEFSDSQRARSFISIVQEDKCPLVYSGTGEVQGISK